MDHRRSTFDATRTTPRPHDGPAGDRWPRRVSVVGSSGSGKSTFARRLAEVLAVPVVELDAIFHQPGWVPLPVEAFREQVARAVAEPSWVVDGNYSAVRPIVWARADAVVFLDLPRWQVMAQLVPRSVRRSLTGEELWNGNRETLRWLWSWKLEDNILRWSWERHGLQRERFVDALADPQWAGVRFVRLRDHAEAERWLEAVARRT